MRNKSGPNTDPCGTPNGQFRRDQSRNREMRLLAQRALLGSSFSNDCRNRPPRLIPQPLHPQPNLHNYLICMITSLA